MRKIVLDVEALEVETFETATERAENGTVRGHEDDSYAWTDDPLAGECRSNFYDTRCVFTNCGNPTC